MSILLKLIQQTRLSTHGQDFKDYKVLREIKEYLEQMVLMVRLHIYILNIKMMEGLHLLQMVEKRLEYILELVLIIIVPILQLLVLILGLKLKVKPEQQELKVILAPLDLRVLRGKKVLLEQQDLRDHKGSKEKRVIRATKEIRVIQLIIGSHPVL